MNKTKYVNLPRSVRVDPDLSRSLREMADEEHRSVANLINMILIKAVEEYKEVKGENIQ